MVNGTAGRLKAVTIYTDGGCEGNPGPGGWGVVLLWNGLNKELHGGEPATTNNRMELTAAIEGLHVLKEQCAVRLFTDSQYVQKGISQWLPRWKARGWRTSSKAPVKNADLWKRLEAAAAKHKVEWCWVKGHAGNENNERCDRLANSAIAQIKKSHDPGQLKLLVRKFMAVEELTASRMTPSDFT